MIELLGAIFVAVIFLSSYAAVANNNSGQSSTTTTAPSQGAFYAVGTTNAVLVGYGPVLEISSLACNSVVGSKTSTQLQNRLQGLEVNNTVSNYYSPSADQIAVDSGTQNVSSIYGSLYPGLNQTQAGCTTFGAQAQILLNNFVNFKISGQTFSVYLSSNGSRLYTIPENLTQNLSGNYLVKVAALLNENGTVNGNLTIISAKSA